MTLSITVDTAGQLRSELDGHPVSDDELHLIDPDVRQALISLGQRLTA